MLTNKEDNPNKVNGLINDALEQLRALADSNTIIGDIILSQNGTTIIPVSKASIGFILGGGEYCDLEKRKYPINFPMAGGSGGGVMLSPIGFLIENKSGVSFLSVENTLDTTGKIINLVSKAISIIEKKEKKDNTDESKV